MSKQLENGGAAHPLFRIIIWGTGREYQAHLRRIQCGVQCGEFEVVGVTSDDTWYKKLDGFRFIPKSELMAESFDFILVTCQRFWDEIQHDFRLMGGDRELLLPVDVLNLANLTFSQYVEIYRSHLSIIPMNCWGGLTYHMLHMKFRTPFINMFLLPDGYLDLLRDFHHRIQLDPEYVRDEYEDYLAPSQRFDYPVFSLGGTLLYMNHYHDRAVALAKWKERVKRINFDNLFFMMCTDRPDAAEQFDALPYKKKICFTSFPTDLSSAMYVSPHAEYNQARGKHFHFSVNGMARGMYQLYDVYELLMHGRKCYRTE